MPTVGTTSKPAYVYDAGSDTWIPIGPGSHTHDYIDKSVITTTGDIIYASAANTPARLGIGSSSQVLTVSGGVPTWSTPSSGGMTLINSGGTTLTGSSVSISSIPGTYNYLILIVEAYKPATNDTALMLRLNGDSATNYAVTNANDTSSITFVDNFAYSAAGASNNTSNGITFVQIYGYANTTTWKSVVANSITNTPASTSNANFRAWRTAYNQTGAITSITLAPQSGNFTSGTAYLYGVK